GVGIRWVAYDGPGYAGTTPNRGRDVASAAADVSSIADALGIKEFAVMGHSGGSPHALACAALLPARVVGVVCVSGTAPFGAEGLDWFAGMAAAGEAELHAAVAGRSALESYVGSTEFDMEIFHTLRSRRPCGRMVVARRRRRPSDEERNTKWNGG